MIGSFDSLALWLHLFSLCDGWVRYRGVIKSKSKTKICTHFFFFNSFHGVSEVERGENKLEKAGHLQKWSADSDFQPLASSLL